MSGEGLLRKAAAPAFLHALSQSGMDRKTGPRLLRAGLAAGALAAGAAALLILRPPVPDFGKHRPLLRRLRRHPHGGGAAAGPVGGCLLAEPVHVFCAAPGGAVAGGRGSVLCPGKAPSVEAPVDAGGFAGGGGGGRGIYRAAEPAGFEMLRPQS